MRFRMMGAEAVRSITANISTAAAATVTVLIGMFLVGLLIAFGSYAHSWSEKQKSKLLVDVYMCTDAAPEFGGCGKEATREQTAAVGRRLRANPLVQKVTFVSREKALADLRKTEPDMVELLTSNPLPDAWKVKPKHGEDTKRIAASLNPKPPGVQEVKYGAKTTSRILNAARVIEGVFLVAIIILLVASALLIANTIRLSIFARRREIEVMKLVGASNWFVRGPFLLEGVMTGVAGAVLAVLFLVVGREVIWPSIVPRFTTEAGVNALAFEINALILLALGLVLGAAGSGVTLRRFLRV